MNKKIFFLSGLMVALLFFMSCTNILGEQSKKQSSISISLPYGNSSASRAAENDKDVYSFTVTFKHESGSEVVMRAKSGESITYAAQTGKYKITVKGTTASGKKAEGFTEAVVEEGKQTSVSISLKVVDDGLIEIKVLSFTEELSNMVQFYIDTHPDCGLKLNHLEVSTTEGDYTPYLNRMLVGSSDEFVPDLYAAEAAFVMHYTKGAMGAYALPYKDLIDDLDTKIEDAELAQYTVDIGKNASGDVVGLAYQATGGAFIYNRTVAKQVFGTDNPKEIEKEIGAGSGDWTKFWEAAETCKSKNVAIISGDGDLWHPVAYTADNGWVVNGKLHIDSKREAFLDYSKTLTDKGFSNITQDWTEEWYADMDEKGPKPVLGFFGPAWLISYTFSEKSVETKGDWAVCAPPVGFSWGGSWIEVNKVVKKASPEKQEAIAKLLEWLTLDTTEDGLLYNWANGKFTNETKDTVSSAVVMRKSNGELALLGNQDIFECYAPINEQVNAKNLTEYDDEIDRIWREQVRLYAYGRLSREQALLNFICGVQVKLGLSYDEDLGTVYFQSEHVKAEPDPNGKGVRFTLTALDGENWKHDSIRILEKNSGIFVRMENSLPTPDAPLVCYFPFTEDGKGYAFDCEFDVSDDENTGHVFEQVYSLAKGSYASASVDLEALKGLAPEVDLNDGFKVKLSKDIGSAVTYSSNVNAYLDFGAFRNATDEAGKYWTWEDNSWLNSIFPEITDSAIQKNGTGLPMLKISRDTVFKLKESKYFFVNMEINFGLAELADHRFGYVNSFLSDIYDTSGKFDDYTSNDHISIEPCEKGIKVTLKYLEGDGEWKDWTRVSNLLSDGSAGISFNTDEKRTPNVNDPADVDIGNGCPSAANPVMTYIYLFTKAGSKYEFELDAAFVTGEGSDEKMSWLNEYVCCKAGGGIGDDIINADKWNNDISVGNYDYTNKTFKINGDFESLFNDNANLLTEGRLFVDVYPGTEDNRRDSKFSYASRPVALLGYYDTWMRSKEDLTRTFTVDSDHDASGNLTEDIDSAIAEYGGKFWVTISLQNIHVSGIDDMEYFLLWK